MVSHINTFSLIIYFLSPGAKLSNPFYSSNHGFDGPREYAGLFSLIHTNSNKVKNRRNRSGEEQTKA